MRGLPRASAAGPREVGVREGGRAQPGRAGRETAPGPRRHREPEVRLCGVGAAGNPARGEGSGRDDDALRATGEVAQVAGQQLGQTRSGVVVRAVQPPQGFAVEQHAATVLSGLSPGRRPDSASRGWEVDGGRRQERSELQEPIFLAAQWKGPYREVRPCQREQPSFAGPSPAPAREGAGDYQRSRVRSRVLVSIQTIRGYEPRPATGPRASRCAAVPPAGVEPAFPASDAGVVSVGPRGLRRVRAGEVRRMQESNPRGRSAHPTTVFETAALPLGQSSLARQHPSAAVVRGGRAGRTRAGTCRPGPRISNPVPCHSASPPRCAAPRCPSRVRTSVAGSRVRSPAGWTNGHRVVLPGQDSNLALRNQNPPCCRIHHPGKRALARSRTWTVRSLGPVPLPVGLRGLGVRARGDPSSMELRAVAGIRTPTGLTLSQVPLPVGLQPRSACGSRTRVFGVRAGVRSAGPTRRAGDSLLINLSRVPASRTRCLPLPKRMGSRLPRTRRPGTPLGCRTCAHDGTRTRDRLLDKELPWPLGHVSLKPAYPYQESNLGPPDS